MWSNRSGWTTKSSLMLGSLFPMLTIDTTLWRYTPPYRGSRWTTEHGQHTSASIHHTHARSHVGSPSSSLHNRGAFLQILSRKDNPKEQVQNALHHAQIKKARSSREWGQLLSEPSNSIQGVTINICIPWHKRQQQLRERWSFNRNI